MTDSSAKLVYQKVPRVSVDDLKEAKFDLTQEEEEALDEFEELWAEFVSDKTTKLPLGEKGENIGILERQILEITKTKLNVQGELQNQLNFFESSRNAIEERYQAQINQATAKQQGELENMTKILEQLTVSARNSDLNCPWSLFFESLDEAVEQSGVKQLPGDGISLLAPSSRALKPSTRAMFLNHAFDENTSPGVSSRDYMIRAYKIDQALLTAEVRAMNRAIEQHETAKAALEYVGNALTEHNAWGLLALANGPSDNEITSGFSIPGGTRMSLAAASRRGTVPV